MKHAPFAGYPNSKHEGCIIYYFASVTQRVLYLHEWSFNDVEGFWIDVLHTMCFLCILNDVFVNALKQEIKKYAGDSFSMQETICLYIDLLL